MSKDFVRGLIWIQTLMKASLGNVKPKDYHRATLDWINTIDATLEDLNSNTQLGNIDHEHGHSDNQDSTPGQ